MMAEGKPDAVAAIHQKIKEAFAAFDYESNNTMDVREVGTIIHALGCFPSQANLQDFITELEEDQTGFIHLDKFLPAATSALLEKKFPPITEDVLLQAFEVLDKEKKGYLESDELKNYLTQEGEPLTQEEMDEMLAGLADKEDHRVYYKDLLSQLTIDCD
ncbi:dynein regulatory complex protein 8-like [Nelusetta ayraudi]|uniref:dynein regulatory complex protein 8-like n=1 Tax=Nelusetta ayraudi TaxID=303726 RepID=UPI003F71ACFF